MEPDADDTAKGITALSLLGTEITRDPLVMKFGSGEWFKTYSHERNVSFSTNCNVLMALVSSLADKTSRKKYYALIEKIVTILANTWLEKPNCIRDKWVSHATAINHSDSDQCLS